MTIHYYRASLQDASGEKMHVTVFWDKQRPRILTAHLCPHTSPHEVGYPTWTADAPYKKSGLISLIEKIRSMAARTELIVLSEEQTKYAATLREGDEN